MEQVDFLGDMLDVPIVQYPVCEELSFRRTHKFVEINGNAISGSAGISSAGNISNGIDIENTFSEIPSSLE